MAAAGSLDATAVRRLVRTAIDWLNRSVLGLVIYSVLGLVDYAALGMLDYAELGLLDRRAGSPLKGLDRRGALRRHDGHIPTMAPAVKYFGLSKTH